MASAGRTDLSSEIYETIRQRIIGWEYPPNFRLLEESLCQEFGVSRVPVREALHMLERHNLVTKVPYQGCRVQQPDLQEISEWYDVRLALELFVVDQLIGAPATSLDDLHKTWTNFAQVNMTAQDWSVYVQADEDFHEGLAAATGNRALLSMLHDLNERLSFVRVMDIQSADRLRRTCEQHLAILDCIRAGDGAAARTALRLNIAFGRANVEAAVKDALGRAYMSG